MSVKVSTSPLSFRLRPDRIDQGPINRVASWKAGHCTNDGAREATRNRRPLHGITYRGTPGESRSQDADEAVPRSSCVDGRHGQSIDLEQHAAARADRARSTKRDDDGGVEVLGQRGDLRCGLDLGQGKQAA